MKNKFGWVLVGTAAQALFAQATFAQSSVTLYGLVDNGLAYVSNQSSVGSTSGGKSAVKFNTGAWAGSRFGLMGSEDLGGNTKVIFRLESGFNTANGNQQFANAEFGREASLGVTNPAFGTFKLGRMNTAYYTMLSPYSPTNYLTGFTGAHPGDIDSLDTGYRANNTFLYQTPTWNGLTAAASYSMGGVAGSFNSGSTIAAGVQYLNGPFGIAAGYTKINNSTSGGGAWGANSTTSSGGQAGISALTNGYQTAQSQQRIAVTTGYQISGAFDVSASYSNVQYTPGTGSSFRNKAVFNSAGAVLHWKPSVVWDFAAGYAYTRASQSNGIEKAAQYQQFSLSQYYSLSKRTGLYLVQGYQRATGETLGTNGGIIQATANVGDGMNGTPSSGRSQFVAAGGLIHRF
ncbi:porin [Burkholderia stabilis]|uniref:porin n=1 Tax=Burkholderia stabilis TaxID=95485 RepID=UPI0026ABCC16